MALSALFAKLLVAGLVKAGFKTAALRLLPVLLYIAPSLVLVASGLVLWSHADKVSRIAWILFAASEAKALLDLDSKVNGLLTSIVK
jgi:hypothetical protein